MIFRISWGYSNSHNASADRFETALQIAKALIKTQKFDGRQSPTIANTDREDIETDGLTAEQRELCEAAGLEVRRA